MSKCAIDKTCLEYPRCRCGSSSNAPPSAETQLLPAERMALTVALSRARRGDEPLPNTVTMCVFALARLVGLYDYTKQGEVMNPPESAAEGSEARNLNTPTRDGSGAEPQGTEAQATRPSAAPISCDHLHGSMILNGVEYCNRCDAILWSKDG